MAGLSHTLAVAGEKEEAAELTERALKRAAERTTHQPTDKLLDQVLRAAETMETLGEYQKVAVWGSMHMEYLQELHSPLEGWRTTWRL